MDLLAVDRVGIRFGGIVALQGVSFAVSEGQIVGLIGPNGAGKTTLFNIVTRLYRPTAGDVRFEGASLLRLRPHEVIARGIARTFQNVALFRNMSVIDNVLVGYHARMSTPWFVSAAGLPAARRAEREGRSLAERALAEVGLLDVADRPVAGLPFGSLKRVELARALISKPRLLLLDEPAGGLNHEEIATLGQLIRDVHREYRVSILLVEHHMNLVMSVCDQVVVLNFGRRIAAGTPAEVRADPAVIDAYLGAAHGAA